MKPKIVLFDLETLANLPEVMKEFPGISAYPGLSMRASINSVICFGYKVLGDKSATVISAWDFPKRWKKNVNDDFQVVKAAAKILQDADGIVTHNGKKFDLKFLNSRLIHHGLAPLPKIAHIDTRNVARSHLHVFNNRLNTIAKFLGCETKMENGGWDLWVKVMGRDEAAQDKMAKYCKQDVEVLEQVYKKLIPFVSNIPNYSLFDKSRDLVCPSCGSHRVFKNGIRVAKTSTNQRYRCKSCGSNFHVDKSGKKPRVA